MEGNEGLNKDRHLAMGEKRQLGNWHTNGEKKTSWVDRKDILHSTYRDSQKCYRTQYYTDHGTSVIKETNAAKIWITSRHKMFYGSATALCMRKSAVWSTRLTHVRFSATHYPSAQWMSTYWLVFHPCASFISNWQNKFSLKFQLQYLLIEKSYYIMPLPFVVQ